MPDQFLHGVEVVEITDGLRPIQTVQSAVIGIIGTAPDADANIFPLNTPVLLAGRPPASADIGADGTLKNALDGIYDQAGAVVVVVRVEEGVNNAATLDNVIGDAGDNTGVHAFKTSQSVLGVTPRILIAPGFSFEAAVTTELLVVANKVRGIVVADAGNASGTAAAAQNFASGFGSDRLYCVFPYVKVLRDGVEAAEPTSSRAAGLIAKSDNDRGFWWSPSNQEILGITGTATAIDFQLGEASSLANILNENKVATVIRQDGFRLWGNRSTATDTNWMFLQTRRTADIINQSLLRAHMWAVDRNITKTYISDVTAGVNSYLNDLKAQGAILGGNCWADPELNTPSAISQGKVYFSFDFTPPYPAEHVTFRSLLTKDYLEDIV
jgi:phage tail sheath protein FI